MDANSQLDWIARKILTLIADSLRRPVDEITLDARLDAAGLGIDSLGLIRLSVAIEEAFDITMPDFTSIEEAPLGSVRDLVRFVSERVAARTASGAGAGAAQGGAP